MLPDKLSDLIDVACGDMKSVLSDPRYVYSSNIWYNNFQDTCYVCVAGCVIAGTLDTGSKNYIVPESYNEDISKKLYALDNCRAGTVGFALYLMEHPRSLKYDRRMPSDWKDLVIELGKLAVELREDGY